MFKEKISFEKGISPTIPYKNIPCRDVTPQSYECAYHIYLPWKCKFPWEDDSQLEPKLVSIDKCLLSEIVSLWEEGIKTTDAVVCLTSTDEDAEPIYSEWVFLEDIYTLNYNTDKDTFMFAGVTNKFPYATLVVPSVWRYSGDSYRYQDVTVFGGENAGIVEGVTFPAGAGVKTVIMNSNITTISDRAFYGSTTITDIILSSSLTRINSTDYSFLLGATTPAADGVFNIYYHGTMDDWIKNVYREYEFSASFRLYTLADASNKSGASSVSSTVDFFDESGATGTGAISFQRAIVNGTKVKYGLVTNLVVPGSATSITQYKFQRFTQLTSVDFSRANVSECDFSGAILNGTSFNYAAVNYSNFSDADMAGANFSEADLSDSDFSTSENLDSCRFDESTIWPDEEKLPEDFDCTYNYDLSTLRDDEEGQNEDY